MARIRLATIVGLAALAAAPMAPAAPPRAAIDAPATARPGQAVFLDGSASASDGPLAWRLIGPGRLVPLPSPDGRWAYALIPSADLAEYRVALIASGTPEGKAEAEHDFAVAVIAVPGPAPQPPPPAPAPAPDPAPQPRPDPGPAPVPEPAPAPVAGRMHATLVIDLARPDPGAGRLASEPGLIPGMEALDCRWRVYPADHPALAARNFAPTVQRAGGPPCLIVQDAAGKVLWAGRPPGAAAGMPPSATAAIDLVKRLRAGGGS